MSKKSFFVVENFDFRSCSSFRNIERKKATRGAFYVTADKNTANIERRKFALSHTTTWMPAPRPTLWRELAGPVSASLYRSCPITRFVANDACPAAVTCSSLFQLQPLLRGRHNPCAHHAAVTSTIQLRLDGGSTAYIEGHWGHSHVKHHGPLTR